MFGILKTYRVFSGRKVGSARLLFYPLAGFCLNRSFQPWLFAADLALVFSGILFATALNDYYDHKLENERNALGESLGDDASASAAKLKLLIAVPLILPFSILYPLWKLGAPPASIAALFASLALGILYCAPPFRWKGKKLLGILAPPLGLYLIFLQAAILSGPLDALGIAYAILLLAFAWHLEFLHLADDATKKNEIPRMSAEKAMRAAAAVSAGAAVAGAALTALSPLFAIPAFFWCVRRFAVKRAKENGVGKPRLSPFSRIYCVEEFPITLGLLVMSRAL
jgi:hypothetical protein